VSLLFISSVLAGTPCPNATVTKCAAFNESCGYPGYEVCNSPLLCLGAFSAQKCANPGVIGQGCSTAADCTNITGVASIVCTGTNTCQYASYLGFNEVCTYNESCVSQVCDNGKCNASSSGSCSNGCPAGQYCNSTVSGTCVDQLKVGDNCTSDQECSGLSVCDTTAKVCTKQVGVKKLDDSCGYKATACSGCLGCKFSANKCAPLSKVRTWNTTECDAVSFGTNVNCTTGNKYCSCDPTPNELRCQIEEVVISYGAFMIFFMLMKLVLFLKVVLLLLLLLLNPLLLR
jgi:hypothetical protein